MSENTKSNSGDAIIAEEIRTKIIKVFLLRLGNRWSPSGRYDLIETLNIAMDITPCSKDELIAAIYAETGMVKYKITNILKAMILKGVFIVDYGTRGEVLKINPELFKEATK